MYIRKLLDDEYEYVIKLIYSSVHEICKNDYSEVELSAWAPENFDRVKFQKALCECYNTVMIDKNDIVGFLSIERDGYLNRLYTHPAHCGKGIATALLLDAQKWAAEEGITEIRLDSSKTAEGFYLKNGFTECGLSVLTHNGVVFRNKTMHKFI